MILAFRESIAIARSAAEIFDHTNAPENFVTFVGYGPIPGIRSVRYRGSDGARLGAVRDVANLDGSTHVEEVVAFERPTRHNARITGFGAPFKWLAQYAEDDWTFHGGGGETRIDREFRVALTTPLVLPVALGLRLMLREAVRRDLANIKRALETR